MVCTSSIKQILPLRLSNDYNWLEQQLFRKRIKYRSTNVLEGPTVRLKPDLFKHSLVRMLAARKLVKEKKAVFNWCL